jgi:hypothetical protein
LLSNIAEQLISPITIINVANKDRGLVDPIVFLPPKFFNDLDIIDRTTRAGEERIVYLSDTSYKNTRSENRREILDGAPRGRLFSFNVNRKQLTVLACGLHFPNGVQMLNDREIILAESTRFRFVLLCICYLFKLGLFCFVFVIFFSYLFLFFLILFCTYVYSLVRMEYGFFEHLLFVVYLVNIIIIIIRVLKIDVQSLMDEGTVENPLLQSCKEHGSLWTYLNTTEGNKVRERQ